MSDSIPVLNSVTGEVDELPTGTAREVRVAYEVAKNLEREAKKLRTLLYDHAKRIVETDGDGLRYRYDDGYVLSHVAGQRFAVDAAKVYSALGDVDMFMELVKVNKGTVEKQMAEWVKEGKLDSATSRQIKEAFIPKGASDHFMLGKEA